MRIELPDVNALIALVDPAHVHHERASRWFTAAAQRGWATCPLTENGVVRVLSTPAYPGVRLRAADAVALLDLLIRNHAATFHFWSETVSLRDRTLFDPQAIAGPGQVTDVYLLGLCQRHGGTLATLDSAITAAAILAPHPALIRLL